MQSPDNSHKIAKVTELLTVFLQQSYQLLISVFPDHNYNDIYLKLTSTIVDGLVENCEVQKKNELQKLIISCIVPRKFSQHMDLDDLIEKFVLKINKGFNELSFENLAENRQSGSELVSDSQQEESVEM